MDAEPRRHLERVRNFWDGQARWNAHVAIYDTEAVRDPEGGGEAFDRAGAEDARRMSWFVHPGTRVVDLGCGIGRVMRHLAPHCKEIIGVDISEEMVAKGREFLAGIPNARLVATDGAALPGIEDGSVGFLYSLLCLIHVDRRSAYRYLQEIVRVLEPGGLAFLQFQSILSDRGMEKFLEVVDSDYPLEFYTPQELRRLLRSAGLEVLCTHESQEYVFLTVIRGSAERWIEDIARSVSTGELERGGSLVGTTIPLDAPGEVKARVRSSLQRPLPMLAMLEITAELSDGTIAPVLQAEAVVVLDPDRDHVIGFSYAGDRETVRITLDGRLSPSSRSRRISAPDSARGVLNLGLLPPGFLWGEDTLRRFPGLCSSWPVQVEVT